MIPLERLDEIRVDPFLKYMIKPALGFNKYLDDTDKIKLNLRGLLYGQTDSEGEPIDPIAKDTKIPFSHRWTKQNDNLRLFNLHNWKYYYIAYPDKTPKYTLMVSSTGSHASPRQSKRKGLNHMQFLAKLHEARRKHKQMTQKYLNTKICLSILEGHPQSGYAHSHDLYMLDELPSDKTCDLLKNHWNKTLKMGSEEHGIKFDLKEPKDFNDVKSLIAYPLSYMGKSSIGAIGEWSKYDVIFNTCIWLSGKLSKYGGIGTRVRAFQPSRALGKIMSHGYLPSGQASSARTNPNYFHIETTLKCPPSRIGDAHPGGDKVIYQCPTYDEDIKTWRCSVAIMINMLH